MMQVEEARLKDMAQAASNNKDVKNARKTPVQMPESALETACFLFVQGRDMDAFQQGLASSHCGTDRTFAVVLFQCLVKLIGDWVQEAIVSAQHKLGSMQQSGQPKLLTSAKALRIIISIDEDSEVHRFVGSAICSYSKYARGRQAKLERLMNERAKAYKAPKQSHEKKIRTVKSSLLLLRHIGILREALPTLADKSYNSPVLDSRNRGGLQYVSPKFLVWAKELMKTIHASISKDMIEKHGRYSEQKAYEYVREKKHLKEWYKDKVVELEKEIHTEFMQASVNWVFQKIVDFAFHARSAVEWNKYRAQHTDRTCGKEKKMGQREILKGGGKTKQDKQ